MALAAPLLPHYLAYRQRHGKELPERLPERYGHATQARPAGLVLWVHGASVGEGMSVLPLLERICALNPDLNILFTSGTVASANLIGKRLPAKGTHQFIPLDVPSYGRAFLDHWKPDAAIWLESELWPNLLEEMRRRKLPALRLNARLTDRSARSWRKVARWFGDIQSSFSLSLALSPQDAANLKAAGAENVHFDGNLKFTVPTPAYHVEHLDELKTAIGTRPCWLFASSHPGEEELALRVHTALAQRWPTLLTLIAPRHATRGDQIEKMIPLPLARRSRGELPQPEHAIYLADTMGEMGVLLRAAPIVVMGGSFTPVGGHNPIEPAQCGAATLIGPDVSKCADVVQTLFAAKALIPVPDENSLVQEISGLLNDPARIQAMAEAGLAATNRQASLMQTLLTRMSTVLSDTGIRTS